MSLLFAKSFFFLSLFFHHARSHVLLFFSMGRKMIFNIFLIDEMFGRCDVCGRRHKLAAQSGAGKGNTGGMHAWIDDSNLEN